MRARSWAGPNRSWVRRKGSRAAATHGAVGDAPDAEAIKNAAAASFAAEYGPGPGAPIVVVVPAFNETGSIAAVIGAIPARIGDLDTEIVVVDDGSTDSTASVARGAGAMVCHLSVNLGQGHALRLGYRLASQRRARLIATVDADGQFDPTELPALIAPLVSGAADFVNGSRRLGRSESSDPVRKLGVVVFSALFRILTGVGVTDPACGLTGLWRGNPRTGATAPGPIPNVGTPDRCHRPRFPRRGGARDRLRPYHRRFQKGWESRLRVPVRASGAHQLVGFEACGSTAPDVRVGSGAKTTVSYSTNLRMKKTPDTARYEPATSTVCQARLGETETARAAAQWVTRADAAKVTATTSR